MARITAGGAHEVARIQTQSEAGYTYLWVMCSDGRVLRRCNTPGFIEGYTVYRRRVPQNARLQATLMTMAQEANQKVIPNAKG